MVLGTHRLAPHSAAKAASSLSRCGLSPAVMSRAAALSGPTPRCDQAISGQGRIAIQEGDRVCVLVHVVMAG